MKQILNFTIFTLLILLFLSISSCSLYQTKETEPSEEEADTKAVEEKEPEEEKPELRNVEPRKKEEKERDAALVPQEGKTKQVLAALPQRVADFLMELKNQSEEHNWDWLLTRAESEDFRAARDSDIRTKESYISTLLGFGESLETDFESWPEYIEPIQANEIDRLEYTGFEKDFISYLVGGIIIDKKGHRYPFAIEVLGELEEILISTVKP